MSNLRIITTNLADSATLTASPTLAASLPVTNLQNPLRSRVARTTSTADQTILGDFSAARTVSAVVLWRHNLTEDATWRVELFDGAGQTGTQVYDSTALAITDREGWTGPFQSALWFSPVSVRSFRITLSDAANPDGYLQVGRLLIGDYWSPVENAEYGHALAWEDPSETVRTEGGSLRTLVRDKNRTLTFSLAQMVETDRAALVGIMREVGAVGEVFISFYPEAGGALERDYQILGQAQGGHSSVAPQFGRWSDRLTIVES